MGNRESRGGGVADVKTRDEAVEGDGKPLGEVLGGEGFVHLCIASVVHGEAFGDGASGGEVGIDTCVCACPCRYVRVRGGACPVAADGDCRVCPCRIVVVCHGEETAEAVVLGNADGGTVAVGIGNEREVVAITAGGVLVHAFEGIVRLGGGIVAVLREVDEAVDVERVDNGFGFNYFIVCPGENTRLAFGCRRFTHAAESEGDRLLAGVQADGQGGIGRVERLLVGASYGY